MKSLILNWHIALFYSLANENRSKSPQKALGAIFVYRNDLGYAAAHSIGSSRVFAPAFSLYQESFFADPSICVLQLVSAAP